MTTTKLWGIFFDISKAFDKVRYEGIIHKLKRNRISGNLWSLLTTFDKLNNNLKEINK